MHEFFAKIVRFAFSKAAAFAYAVAVGVSGNLAFNYLQPKDTAPPPAAAAPAPAAAPAVAPSVVAPSAAAPVTAPMTPVSLPQSSPATPPASTPVSVSGPIDAARPAATRPVAAAPILPDPQAAPLPNPGALPSPLLKPAAMPSRDVHKEPAKDPATIATEAAAKFDSAARPEPAPATATNGPLSPIGPAIDVAPLPSPPAAAPVATAVMAPVNEPAKRQPWELSDFWHPVRAVGKAGDWAGDQLPTLGGTAAETRPRTTPISGPISLLPSDQASGQEPAKAPAPVKPGPGSGGLY